MRLRTDEDERLYAADLVEAATDALRRIAIRTVYCQYDDGILFLRGQVPTFYHKQMIQETVVRLKGVAQVVNEVEVPAPRPR